MTCSTSSLNRLAALVAASALAISGCSAVRSAAVPGPGLLKAPSIAVMPVENLSGSSAPLKVVQQSLEKDLRARGISVVEDGVVEKFMERHRLRNTGGIDRETAAALAPETGANAAIITSIELFSPTSPPKVAIISRLVSVGAEPRILWMDSVGVSGDDHPGFLGLGLVENTGELMEKAVGFLAGSLAGSISGAGQASTAAPAKKFRPKYSFKSPVLSADEKYTVAVVPFFNKSERKDADQIMMLHMIKELVKVPGVTVIEPGVMRDDLLSLRVVMDEGLTLDTAEAVLSTLRADLLVMGTVLDYEDYSGPFGKPKVDFSVQVLEKKSMQVVWSSKSRNEGDEGVWFFDRGKFNTAERMASGMAGNIVEMLQGQ